jgi:hypothetical protein
LVELPVWRVTLVSASKIPSKCAVAPTVAASVTTQTIFLASAPPDSVIRCAAAILNVLEI